MKIDAFNEIFFDTPLSEIALRTDISHHFLIFDRYHDLLMLDR